MQVYSYSHAATFTTENAITSLSQYMRAERVDVSEPASFYVPGAQGWYDPKLRGLMGRRNEPAVDEVLFVAVSIEITEPEEH